MISNGTDSTTVTKYRVGNSTYTTSWEAVKASIDERNRTSNGSSIEEIKEVRLFSEFYY